MLNLHKGVLFTIGLLHIMPTAAFNVIQNEFHVPTFSVSSLLTGNRMGDFGSALSTTGLIAIELDDSSYQKARRVALNGLCQCAESTEFLQVGGTDAETLVSDTSTTRTTFATATVGNTPLSLYQEALEQACGSETSEHMELLRDYVAHASSAFIAALDRLLNPGETPLLRTTHGAKYSSVHSIVKASTNLEHFHVYSKHPSASDIKVLDIHTDAGLFLTFVPGQSCNGNDENSHFYIQTHDNTLQGVVFPPRSIGIMLGAGSQHWLDTNVPLQATRHAVQMQPGETRAWYGMMHLVPQHAIVQQHGSDVHTFRDLQQAMSSTLKNDVSIGCGNSHKKVDAHLSTDLTVKRRRRLQHITNGSSCNNVTNFFCWMTCQDIPDVDNVQENIDQGKSLYCLEPAILASSGISNAVNSCTEIGIVGGAMNEACVGSWEPTAEGVTSQEIRFNVTADQLDEPFCYGGTSMYMDGFQWIDSTCVIYLFPEWVLKTPAAMVGACIGTLAFAIALEGVIFARRRTVQSMPSGWRQVGISTLMYGVQLTMGYMLMLVVMTYSGPLFLCVVVGLMMGHLCFNSKMFNGRDNKLRDSKMDDSCSRTNHIESGASSEVDCCRRQSTDRSVTPCVPEGSTPCCQNIL